MLGGLWNLLHFFLGLVVCALTVVILPIGFGALAQMMGLERSLEAVSISISQTTAFLLSVGFFGFLICLPYVANQLARWLRLLARHLMVDEIGDAGSERVYHARVRVSPSGPNSAAVALSSREQEILVRVAEGLRNREIAERIFITGETVKSHMSSILAKLGVDNRTQAVSEALRLGILDIETRE
ncbi:MAG: response regulator transcription factor [Propionibacteriaceae bacterium]|nr:response regulator transcription factor [Propionibacteriaceae bacterium]